MDFLLGTNSRTGYFFFCSVFNDCAGLWAGSEEPAKCIIDTAIDSRIVWEALRRRSGNSRNCNFA